MEYARPRAALFSIPRRNTAIFHLLYLLQSRYNAGMNTNNFFIYARKSTDDADRQVRSIDDQLAELRDLATKEGITVVDTLVEKQSAKVPGRSVFNEMIARIEAGEAAGILAWHPDRLARNSLDPMASRPSPVGRLTGAAETRRPSRPAM
jgi:hypothetical protein